VSQCHEQDFFRNERSEEEEAKHERDEPPISSSTTLPLPSDPCAAGSERRPRELLAFFHEKHADREEERTTFIRKTKNSTLRTATIDPQRNPLSQSHSTTLLVRPSRRRITATLSSHLVAGQSLEGLSKDGANVGRGLLDV
jgi:hypothetical protein